MKNLGIARAKVEIYDGLPNLYKDIINYNFHVTSFLWEEIKKSIYFYPLLTEFLGKEDKSFGALFPSKRKWVIDNYLSNSPAIPKEGEAAPPYILWKPIKKESVIGVFKTILSDYTEYTGEIPVNPPDVPSNEWKGPIWQDSVINKDPYPDDEKTINGFLAAMGIDRNYVLDCKPAIPENEIADTFCAYQGVVREGLWWAIRSHDFLTENMPFWVSIKKPFPPTSAKLASFIVIQIGRNDPNNRYDIWLSSNQVPRIIDYTLPTSGDAVPIQTGGAGDENRTPIGFSVEFEGEGTRVLSSQEDIEIGVMVVGGRLVVYVNGNRFIYTKTIKDTNSTGAGSLMACKIPAGGIDIYGTNIQARLNVSPMVFAPLACFTLPIPQQSGSRSGVNQQPPQEWKGVTAENEPGDSVCHLPTPDSQIQEYGCDCEKFNGDGGTASPDGLLYRKKGIISFRKATASLFERLPDTDFYYLVMRTGNSEMLLPNGDPATICYGGAPYFFQLKGIIKMPPNGGVKSTIDVSDYVVTVNETFSAPDYFHVKKNATVTLYNPGGVVSNILKGLLKNQYGISVSWGWSIEEDMKKTFTGIIKNVTSSHTPGKEMLTLDCEDYFQVLSTRPIINSPFYDGMFAFYAIKDVAEKGGCVNVQKNWEEDREFFLPSGFTFTEPAMRFKINDTLEQCILNMAQRFEAFVFFDEEGRFNVSKLPGGLFSSLDGETPSAFFRSNPESDADEVILGQRDIGFYFDSTVNQITILTVDRDTRAPIIYGKTATPREDKLQFRKILLRHEAAFGSLEVAKSWAAEAMKRVFSPILKTSIKTIGAKYLPAPLSFISIDGQPFRLMSVKREFNADRNEFNASYEAEWLGGERR